MGKLWLSYIITEGFKSMSGHLLAHMSLTLKDYKIWKRETMQKGFLNSKVL